MCHLGGYLGGSILIMVGNSTSGYLMSPTTSNNILVYELLLVVVILDWELCVILEVTLDIGTYKPGSWAIVVQDAPLFDPGLQGSVACSNHLGLFSGGCFKWSKVILPHIGFYPK
jgi:hypothetical protein